MRKDRETASVPKRCRVCRGPFSPKVSRQVNCSNYCQVVAFTRKQAMKRRQARVHSKRCAYRPCQRKFETRLTRRVFCHDNCRQASGRRVRRECRKFEAQIAMGRA